MPAQVFAWVRYLALTLSIVWAASFGYIESVALNYSALREIVLSHFTIENLFVGLVAAIIGLLPFAVAIRFGNHSLSRKAAFSAAQVFAIAILAEDIAYFVSLGTPIRPTDWTAQILGGVFFPGTALFVPTWYFLAIAFVGSCQFAISRVRQID
jgi:hypothetical protein